MSKKRPRSDTKDMTKLVDKRRVLYKLICRSWHHQSQRGRSVRQTVSIEREEAAGSSLGIQEQFDNLRTLKCGKLASREQNYERLIICVQRQRLVNRSRTFKYVAGLRCTFNLVNRLH